MKIVIYLWQLDASKERLLDHTNLGGLDSDAKRHQWWKDAMWRAPRVIPLERVFNASIDSSWRMIMFIPEEKSVERTIELISMLCKGQANVANLGWYSNDCKKGVSKGQSTAGL